MRGYGKRLGRPASAAVHADGNQETPLRGRQQIRNRPTPFWRRLLVHAALTLEQLHDVQQIAIGWEDCDMHDFRIGQQRFGKPGPMEGVLEDRVLPMNEPLDCSRCRQGGKY
jgi:hypothetical protein